MEQMTGGAGCPAKKRWEQNLKKLMFAVVVAYCTWASGTKRGPGPEDTNLSVTVRQRIASDLTVVFSPAPSFEELGTGKGGYVTSEDLELEATGFLTPAPSISMIPTNQRREGIFIVNQNGGKRVHINEVASSNYLHAFTLMDANSNAVQKAHEFVAWLNSPTNNLSSLPLKELKKLHNTLPEVRQIFRDDDYRSFAAELQQSKAFEISALCFFVQKSPEVGDTEVPAIALFTISKSNPTTPFAFPIFFHNGRWGFGKYW